jgi:hypothetical protein
MSMLGVLVLLGLTVLFSGCGGSEGSGGEGDTDSQTRGATTMTIDREEAERFAGIELPAQLSDLQARRVVGPMDESITMRFTVPPEEVDGLRSILTEPLEEGRRKVPDMPELGWEIEDSERFLGASDILDGIGRRVLVDLDVPGRPVVYITAGTAG